MALPIQLNHSSCPKLLGYSGIFLVNKYLRLPVPVSTQAFVLFIGAAQLEEFWQGLLFLSQCCSGFSALQQSDALNHLSRAGIDNAAIVVDAVALESFIYEKDALLPHRLPVKSVLSGML